MLPRYIREMRRCNINASHEIFVAVLPFISLALRTLYRGRGRGYGGGWVGARRQLQQEASQRRGEAGPEGRARKASRGRPRGASSSSVAAATGTDSFASRLSEFRQPTGPRSTHLVDKRCVSSVFRKSLIDGEKSALSETK